MNKEKKMKTLALFEIASEVDNTLDLEGFKAKVDARYKEIKKQYNAMTPVDKDKFNFEFEDRIKAIRQAQVLKESLAKETEKAKKTKRVKKVKLIGLE